MVRLFVLHVTMEIGMDGTLKSKIKLLNLLKNKALLFLSAMKKDGFLEILLLNRLNNVA